MSQANDPGGLKRRDVRVLIHHLFHIHEVLKSRMGPAVCGTCAARILS